VSGLRGWVGLDGLKRTCQKGSWLRKELLLSFQREFGDCFLLGGGVVNFLMRGAGLAISIVYGRADFGQSFHVQ